MYIHPSTCLQLSCLAFFDSFPNASELLKLGWPKLEFSFYGIGGSCSAKGEVSSHQCPCDRMFDPISCNSLLFSCSPTQLHMGTQWSCNKLLYSLYVAHVSTEPYPGDNSMMHLYPPPNIHTTDTTQKHTNILIVSLIGYIIRRKRHNR